MDNPRDTIKTWVDSRKDFERSTTIIKKSPKGTQRSPYVSNTFITSKMEDGNLMEKERDQNNIIDHERLAINTTITCRKKIRTEFTYYRTKE